MTLSNSPVEGEEKFYFNSVYFNPRQDGPMVKSTLAILATTSNRGHVG